MKFLFVTYCMGTAYGQVQIGVYKRGLRLAFELFDRGHEILFFCTGRHNFQDAQTLLAEEKMRFVEIPFLPADNDGTKGNRATYLAWLLKEQPDIVIIGEAPMAGTLLETTLVAVEAGIPVVLLDNAYHPGFVDTFCRKHGPAFDAIILSGPSALQGAADYQNLVQVPPFIEASVPQAEALLEEKGLGGNPLLLFLAYDRKVEGLGFSLLEKLERPIVDALFITTDPDGLWARFGRQVHPEAGRVAVISPPGDEVLFGLLQLARCAVTKCAFMQVTESLTLHTPVIGFYYEGDFSLNIFPHSMRQLSHMTSNEDADEETVCLTQRFLELDEASFKAVHDGGLGAAARAADYLEALPRVPRTNTIPEVSRWGFTEALLESALSKLNNGEKVRLVEARSAFLRTFPNHDVHVLVCRYAINSRFYFARLWGRAFRRRTDLIAEIHQVKTTGSQRQVLGFSPWHKTLVELDLGEETLPSIKELQKLSSS